MLIHYLSSNLFLTVNIIYKLLNKLVKWFTVMVAHLVGGVYDNYKNDISNDVNCLAQCIQKVFQCTVKFTVIPANISKSFKLKIWNDFVLAVDNSIESGKILLTN